MTAAERQLSRLLDQAADDLLLLDAQAEVWERRAAYWRQVAVELASGDREPYPRPGTVGAQALLDRAPVWARWTPEPQEVTPLDRSLLRRWWARGDRALGLTSSPSPIAEEARS